MLGQKYKTDLGFSLELVDMGKKGLGVITHSFIPTGNRIIDYVGNIYTKEQFQCLYDAGLERYCLQIDDDIYMGESGFFDDFVNHSCNPNCNLIEFSGNAGDILALFSDRDITPGEELTFDYSTAMDDDWEMKCECGEHNCRGTIRGFRYLPEGLKKDYLSNRWVLSYIKARYWSEFFDESDRMLRFRGFREERND